MEIGNYRLLKQIGEGGFGRIFQAEHIYLRELACLKQNKESSPEAVEMLRQEARLLWRLNEYHSIPGCKDFIKLEDDNYVMVMDFIDGKTLDGLVEKNGRLHPEDACWIGERLLGALHYCHYNGVIHSDVKPENVFIEEKKHDIKLIDFGLAAVRPKGTTSPSGYTPKYAAPELIDGKPPIPETDLYGAGLVMLYALGGDVAGKIFPKDSPPEVTSFCERLLRYDPSKRPKWKDENLMKSLSDVRLAVFGRRHRSG